MSDYLPQPPTPSAAGWSPVGPYATSSMPMPPMRSLTGLATALTVLFAILVVVELVAAGALFGRAGLFDDAANGIFVGIDEGTDSDNRVAAGILGHLALFVATAVVFIIWQFRHAKNAEVLGTRGGLGPGWAIGGWFIPLANYVLPAVQLHQSSRASDLAGRRQGTKGRGSGIVIVWAILFGLAAVTFVAGGGLAPSDDEGNFEITSSEDFESAASSDRTEGIGMGLYAAAAVVGLLMVRSLTRRQTDVYAALAPAAATLGTGAAPPPSAPGPAWGTQPPPPPPAAPPIPPPPGAPPPRPV